MSELLIRNEEAVRWLILNRPEARNAFTDEMTAAIIEALKDAAEDSSVRVVVVAANGSAFSAGGDLEAMVNRTGMFAGDAAELRDAYMRGLQAQSRAFQAFEKPVIAAINGPAIGAGLGLALHADIRIASERARLGATFAKVGLIPGDGSAYFLIRAIGFPRALELVLTGRVVDANAALSLGLVHEVVDADELEARAGAVAAEIAALPPKAVKLAKSHMYRTAHLDSDTALHLAAAYQGLVQSGDEHVAAAQAVLDSLKR